MPTVAVVILNWNGRKFLADFLPSVVRYSAGQGVSVVLADNASTDDSVAFTKANFPSVKIIPLDVNYGYAGGYNHALKQLDDDYFVLLNSDIEVTPNWIEPIVQMMEGNVSIGAVQPKLRAYHNKQYFEYAGAAGGFIDYLGYPFCRGRIFDTVEEDKGQYNQSSKIFWATGACLFVRRSAFESAGGLDADFFAHMEEIDLCWRMQNLGYEVWYCADSLVYHVGGGSLPYGNARKTFLNFRNNLFMLFKNLPASQLVPKILARMVLDGVAAFQSVAKQKSFSDFNAILKAHFAFYAAIPVLLDKRKRSDNKEIAVRSFFGSSIIFAYFAKGKKLFSQL